MLITAGCGGNKHKCGLTASPWLRTAQRNLRRDLNVLPARHWQCRGFHGH
jgi:hypothetical protein